LTEGKQPKFNPSGTTIAYVYHGKIWTIDVTGKEKKRIGRFMNEARPSWSPDGKRIVFASYGSNVARRFELRIMDSNGTNARRLIEPPTGAYDHDQFPRYSPDGKYIVWTRGKQLWIMDTSGRNAHPLTKERAKKYEYMGDFSPDGKLIAYLRTDSYRDSPQTKIWLTKPNGEDQRIFLDGVGAEWVKWSRDGKFLYYSSWRALWKMGIDGKGAVKEVFDSNLDHLARFDLSSDERWIVYEDTGIDQIESKIYLVHLSGKR